MATLWHIVTTRNCSLAVLLALFLSLRLSPSLSFLPSLLYLCLSISPSLSHPKFKLWSECLTLSILILSYSYYACSSLSTILLFWPYQFFAPLLAINSATLLPILLLFLYSIYPIHLLHSWLCILSTDSTPASLPLFLLSSNIIYSDFSKMQI